MFISTGVQCKTCKSCGIVNVNVHENCKGVEQVWYVMCRYCVCKLWILSKKITEK